MNPTSILAALLLGVAAAAPPAQAPIRASLQATAPTVLQWTCGAGGTQSRPAGPLRQPETWQPPMFGGTTRVSWVPPTASSLECTLQTQLSPPTFSGYCFHSVQAEWTYTVDAPPGTFGHLLLVDSMGGDFPAVAWRIDVHDDGKIDAQSQPPSTMVVPNTRERRLPVTVGNRPLRVRIVHAGTAMAPQTYRLTIAFEPWAAGAADLGSSCGPRDIGWYAVGYTRYNHSYFLAALPGTGGSPAKFVARGYGGLAVFVASDRDVRLPVGSIGIAPGCDDLLSVQLLEDPGVATGIGRWELDVPPLPPGLHLFVQHASLDWPTPGFPPARFGATNIVRLDT